MNFEARATRSGSGTLIVALGMNGRNPERESLIPQTDYVHMWYPKENPPRKRSGVCVEPVALACLAAVRPGRHRQAASLPSRCT